VRVKPEAKNEAIENGYFALGYEPRTFTNSEEFFKFSKASLGAWLPLTE